jgi:prepilin-type N-terminal cleavage/methylation domain-containing protein
VTRRGLTLVELLVTLVVFGILGTALARLMISNSRFVGRQEAALEARQTARAGMHLMTTELRMVSDSGLLAASADSVTVRVPYAFGVLCRNLTAVRMPADSVTLASAVHGGVMYRGTTGAYVTPPSPATIAAGGTPGDCTADSISVTIPGAELITLSQAVPAAPGTIFYAFQVVTYKFAPSDELPGRRALWRRAGGGAAEEILSPFATTARFAFLVGSRLQVQTIAPPLGQIQGLELRLIGESQFAPEGAATPTQYELMPRVKFVNRTLP